MYTYLIEYEFNSSLKEINKSPELISVFPNPATNTFKIYFSSTNWEVYELYVNDLSGKTVFHLSNISESTIEFKRNTLPPGLYILEIRGPKIYRGKVVIE